MATWTGLNHTPAVLQAAEVWKTRCLLGNGSVFSDQSLWSTKNIKELKTLFVDNPVLGNEPFYEKLKKQIGDARPEISQLASEAIWLLLLFVSEKKFGVEKKRERIAEVWNFSGETVPSSDQLANDPLRGLASPGTAFLTKIWAEYGFFLVLLETWKSLQPSEQTSLLQDNPWDFCDWVTKIEGGNVRAFRHMLLYLCYPKHFERVCSRNHKKKIYAVFSDRLEENRDLYKLDRSFCGLDKSILEIRKALESTYNKTELDFYKPPLREQWLDNQRNSKDEDERESQAANAKSGVALCYFVEKTIVSGRPDRESGPHSLGAALWSPQASTDGRDIYKTMRHVQSGDVVLHLIDNQQISGISVASDNAETDFIGLSNTEWADRSAYRIQLRDYEGLSSPIDRTEFFDSPEPRAKLRQIQKNHSGLFYTAGLELNQEAYLTAVPEDLIRVFDDIYREKTGHGLPHVSLGGEQRRTQFKRQRLKGAETLFKWIYGEDGFGSDRYLEEERKYKVELSGEWQSKVNVDTLSQALANSQYQELAKEISDLLGSGRSNLLPWRYHGAIKKSTEGSFAEDLLQSVHNLLLSADTGVADIDAFNEAMMPAYETHVPAAIKPASHCIPSLMLWLSRPEKYFYLRPELYTRTVKGLTGSPPENTGNIMSTEFYSQALSFASDLAGALSGLEPRDMIDVQGFAWGVFSYRKIWFGGKTYTDPETKKATDMLPSFLERNVYAIGWAGREEVVELLSDAPNLGNKDQREERREELSQACQNDNERNAILNFFDLINSPDSLLIPKSTFADARTRQSKLRAFGICRTTRTVSYDEEVGHQVSVDWLNTFEHTVSIGGYFPRVVSTLNSLPLEDALDMLFPESQESPDEIEPVPEEPPLSMQWLSEQTLWDEPDLQEVIDTLNDEIRQIVFAGPPGTGKTWLAKHLARYLTGDDSDRMKTVQFHPSYGYEEFIEGIHPIAKDGAISFQPKKGVVLEIVENMTEEDLPYILLIDEMNRANLPRVFGELMYLFEYRDETVSLQYSPNFSLPGNLLFIGTMNTADRSIRSIDIALRRRFDIFECLPDRKILERYYEWHDNHNNDVPDLFDGFEKLNAQLTKTLDRHHTIGHTFFMSPTMNADRLRRAWERKIAPLIEEYFFDQPATIKEFEISKFWALEE